MKHVYLINNGSRAAQYGVGTYVKQLRYRVMERQRYYERYSLDAMTQQVIACYEDL